MEFLKYYLTNLATFLLIWIVVIVLNQVFLFRGCYALYCLIAALPHTFIISLFFMYPGYRNKNKARQEKKPGVVSRTIAVLNEGVSTLDAIAAEMEKAAEVLVSESRKKRVARLKKLEESQDDASS